MNDLLSASSLFLAVIGLLYSSWYNEIKKTIDLIPEEHLEDRKKSIKTASTVYHTRALPLALATSILTLILLPDFIKILIEAIDSLISIGLKSYKNYNAVKLMYFAIFITTLGLSCHTINLSRKIYSKWKKMLR